MLAPSGFPRIHAYADTPNGIKGFLIYQRATGTIACTSHVKCVNCKWSPGRSCNCISSDIVNAFWFVRDPNDPAYLAAVKS